jgi:tape measure domain-containing protein
MASVQENITIKIREDGSRVVSRNIRDIGDAAEGAEGQLSDLQAILGGLITAATLTSLVRMADEFTNLQNRLRLVTTDSANLARVTKELGSIANATRSDFTATAELYARMATASKELGLSQQDLLDFTKSVNQAVILSGASAEEAAGGLRQLAQGMASGTLRGDELNSILENLPAVADVIAKGLNITRGELRAMGAEGKLTANDIVESFKKAKDELETGFGTTVPTVSQSITVLRNNFVLWLGELDKTYGITAGLSQIIMTLATNLDTLIPILAGVGSAMGVAFSAGLIQKFIVQIRALWALMLANPFVAVAAVVTGLVTTLYLLRDEIKLGIDDTTTLGDLMRAAWESIGPTIQAVADAAAVFFSWLTNTSAGTFDELLNQTVGYQHQSEATWLKLVRVVVQVFDMIGAVIRGTFMGINAVIMNFIAAWMNNFRQLGNAIDGIKELDGDKIKAAITSNLDGYKQAALTAGDAFSSAFQQEVLSQSENGLESILDGWIKRAQEIGKARTEAMQGPGDLAGGGRATIKPPVDEDAMKKAAKELERLKNALDSVRDAADPVGAAERRLAEAQDILNRSVKAGLIDQREAAQVYEELAYQMRDQLDPLAALNREIDESISLLKMSNKERDVEQQMLQLTAQLRRDGVTLTKEETDALRAKLVVEQELARIAQARDQLERDSLGGRQQDFAAQLAAMQQMQGTQGFSAGDQFGAANDALGGLLNGSQAHVQQQLEAQQELFTRLQELRNADLINEQTYAQGRMQIWANMQSIQLQQADSFFGNLAQLSKSENRKIAAIGKAAAIAQTTIKTYEAATSAYASLAGIPYVGPVLGAAAAAAAIAAGMANVRAIQSQSPGFRTGGEFTVGGMGGPDSQLVAFRATPGEKVNVNTPAQDRAIREGGGGQEVSVPVTIVNPPNQEAYLAAMSGREGENIIMNTLEKFPQRVRAIAGAGG